MSFQFLNGKMHFLPLEAVLMYFAMSGQESMTGDSPTVALLDCFDLDDEVVLVMERPEPCMDLSQYIKVFGQMDENMAKVMKQYECVCTSFKSANITCSWRLLSVLWTNCLSLCVSENTQTGGQCCHTHAFETNLPPGHQNV